MTTTIIGTGGIGSAIARQLASGGEAFQLSSSDKESARELAAAIGGAVFVEFDNPSVLHRADAVVLALQFSMPRRGHRRRAGRHVSRHRATVGR